MMPLLAALPAAVSSSASLGQGIYSLIKGIQQNKMANKIDITRPTYNIPSEIKANQQMYQDLANSNRMPGQSIAENNIKSGTANAVNAIAQTGGGVNNILSAINGLNQNQNNAMNQIATQAAQFNLANKDKLAQANSTMADYKNQAFDYNQNQKYLMNLAKYNALKQAGGANINNLFTGVKGSADAVSGAMGGLFGGGGMGK